MKKVTNDSKNNNEKLNDKAFSNILIASALATVICIICLCSSTFAWFTANKSSDNNIIEAGRFYTDVSVTDPLANSITLNEADGVISCSLAAGGVYTVELNVAAASTLKRGHCVIVVDETKYKTDGIYADSALPFTFTIDTTGKTEAVDVTFTAAWGVPATPDITDGGNIS